MRIRPVIATATCMFAALIAGCGPTAVQTRLTPVAREATPVQGSVNRPRAADVVRALSRDGMPVPHALDTTAQECPAAGCDQSIVTDTLRVKSFPSPAAAQQYSAAHGLDRVDSIVVSFAPPVNPSARAHYWKQIESLVEGDE